MLTNLMEVPIATKPEFPFEDAPDDKLSDPLSPRAPALRVVILTIPLDVRLPKPDVTETLPPDPAAAVPPWISTFPPESSFEFFPWEIPAKRCTSPPEPPFLISLFKPWPATKRIFPPVA